MIMMNEQELEEYIRLAGKLECLVEADEDDPNRIICLSIEEAFDLCCAIVDLVEETRSNWKDVNEFYNKLQDIGRILGEEFISDD